jgi:cell division septation protein DedD
MRTNEGEFELVLGNRQLLSGFFVVALLFGVAFAMGYIVGRSSIPSPKAQAEAASSSAAASGSQNRPQPAPPEPLAASGQPSASADPAASEIATQPATEAAATTQPARDGPAAPPVQLGASEPVPSAVAVAAEPEPGTYWQVTAIAQPQAEVFAKVLRDKGFRVSLSPGTKKLTRVLVGPYTDRESLGRAKSDLEGSGFHPVILKKE